MDKSLVSNLIAASVVAAGALMEEPWRPYALNAGLFALSGGVTNWLAVHMLFERVPGLYGSGVVQLRFEDFKAGIRGLIMEQFFDDADLERFLRGAPDMMESVDRKIREAAGRLDLDQAFESLLDIIMASSFAGMLGMVGGRAALGSLRRPFAEWIRRFIERQFADPVFQERLHEAVSGALDSRTVRTRLEELIDRRLDRMTPKMVKEIVQRMIRRHLGWLVVWGCAFGGAIGLAVTAVNGR